MDVAEGVPPMLQPNECPFFLTVSHRSCLIKKRGGFSAVGFSSTTVWTAPDTRELQPTWKTSSGIWKLCCRLIWALFRHQPLEFFLPFSSAKFISIKEKQSRTAIFLQAGILYWQTLPCMWEYTIVCIHCATDHPLSFSPLKFIRWTRRNNVKSKLLFLPQRHETEFPPLCPQPSLTSKLFENIWGFVRGSWSFWLFFHGVH